jgi:hypothetical protein
MGLALDIFPLATLVAGMTSLLLALALRRLLAPAASERFALPTALSLGYCAGYAALPLSRVAFERLTTTILAGEDRSLSGMWSLIAPAQSWQWLPYLGVAVASAAVIPASGQDARRWRWPGLSSSAILAACLLTPSWPVFGAHQPLSIGVAMGYFLLLAIPLELLPARVLGRVFVGLMALSAGLSAVAIGIGVSLRLAQLAAIAAGGFAGCSLAEFLSPGTSTLSIRRLIPLFMVLIAGSAFVGAVEPDPPLAMLLASPATPLFTWLGAIGRRRGVAD